MGRVHGLEGAQQQPFPTSTLPLASDCPAHKVGTRMPPGSPLQVLPTAHSVLQGTQPPSIRCVHSPMTGLDGMGVGVEEAGTVTQKDLMNHGALSLEAVSQLGQRTQEHPGRGWAQ